MSDTPRKTRADSKLKILPPKRREAIAEHGGAHTLAETQAWLKADGIVVSQNCLSEFLAWHALEMRIQRREEAVHSITENFRKRHPEVSDAELFDIGQRTFSEIALAEEDAKAWTKVQEVALKKTAEERATAIFQRDTCAAVIKWCADERARDIAASSLGNEEKIEALGPVLFGDNWKALKDLA
jgi:hypothetical protein